MNLNFADKLAQAVSSKGNGVCVGIDPRLDQMPPVLLSEPINSLKDAALVLKRYAKGVVEAVFELVPVVKFQSAFFEAYGPWGLESLHESMEAAQSAGLVVIFDGKRNDIGSTAEAYAEAYLGRSPLGGGRFASAWPADSITVNPWLGSDGIDPFLKRADQEGKGLFILARTSNPSAKQFQELEADGRPVYRHVADAICSWNQGRIGQCGYGPVGAVVGATSPLQLAELRQAMPETWFLVPGYGAQGGTAADVSVAFDSKGLGAIVNSSRGVGFAYHSPKAQEQFGDQWKLAVANAARLMISDLAGHSQSSGK